jgi:hypothetical protein
MINEGNKEDQYLEKKGESTKTTAMRKASSRRGRFSSGDTHQGSERENITWARPGTRSHADSLDRQRKSAHRSERGRKKPQAGSSPEDRRWAEFSGDWFVREKEEDNFVLKQLMQFVKQWVVVMSVRQRLKKIYLQPKKKM